MYKNEVKFGLRNKLILLFLIMGCIPIILLMYLLNNIRSDNIIEVITNSNKNGIVRNIELIESTVNDIVNTEELDIKEKVKVLKNLPYIKYVSLDKREKVKDEIELICNTNNLDYKEKKIYIYLDCLYIQQMIHSYDKYNKEVYLYNIDNDTVKILYNLNQKYDEKHLIVNMKILDDKVMVVQIIKREEVLKDLLYIINLIIKIIMIGTIISICLACIFSYRISFSIDMLLKSMKDIEEGKFDTNIDIKSKDEIGLLAQSFKNMTEKLNTLINKTYKLKISEREAKIKTLQAQISPHFLYNALDCINWKLIDAEDYETSEILISLSEILRYSIDDSKSFVKIEDEFKQVENYLRIQKNRFTNRFDYLINIDEDLKDKLIPKMILQPIVENAINHGVEDSYDSKINIYTYSSLEYIYICVNDTGKGISKEKLKYINDNMNEYSQLYDENKAHLGLANVNARLKYVFGNDSGIIIDSILGKYTNVLIRIKQEGDTYENIDS